MSVEIGTATSAIDLLDKLNAFIVKGHSLAPSYTGTGNGTITGTIGTASSVFETITITFTSATAFNVVGSVTGSMGSGTVGTLFTHARASFTVNAGGTAWVASDTIAFVMTPPWVQMRGVAGSEYIWKAPGNANSDQIFVGSKYFSDATGGYHNWQLGGFTAYSAGIEFGLQAGSIVNSSSVRGPVLPLWDQAIPYWFIANGRRVIVVAKVSTYYESAYLGFIEAYPTPNQWPYPLAVGGSMAWNTEPAATSSNWKYTNTSGYPHRAFPMAYGETNNWKTQLRMRRPDGSWIGHAVAYSADYGAIWPYANSMTNLKPNLDGSYPIFPIVLSDSTPNVYGRLDGVWATTGVNNSPESTFTIGRETWLVAQNISRNTAVDLFVVKLD